MPWFSWAMHWPSREPSETSTTSTSSATSYNSGKSLCDFIDDSGRSARERCLSFHLRVSLNVIVFVVKGDNSHKHEL